MRVELQDVRKSHTLPGGGIVSVLAGVNLVFESGQKVIIRGESGSGKTTLLNIMGGIARPTSGRVRFNGTDSNWSSDLRRAISYAFQGAVFIPELTVLENLVLPLVSQEHTDLSLGELMLEQFGLAEAFDRFPADLSGGEKQRLNLARSIIAKPRLLLLDEPLAGLEEAWEERALELVLTQICDTRATLMIASASKFLGIDSFRQLRMHKGKVIDDGAIDN
jgi:putative ABC transport system ATP-binding protein